MTLLDCVDGGRARLLRAGISSREAGLDAELLARHVLGWDRATWFANRLEDPPAAFGAEFEKLIRRREGREPVPFILGRREFWGLEFEVSPAVLIPRPETELVVEEAAAAYPSGPMPRRIADVGTGSGCLAVALAREFSGALVTASDVSRDALLVARRNAARHRVDRRVFFVQTSFLDSLKGPWDLIVSNPPYVQAIDAPGLQPEVRDHEPAVALYGGMDGLESFRSVFHQAAARIAPEGWLIVEFGLGQEDRVRELAGASGWKVVRVRSDLQGIPRVAVLKRDEPARGGRR